MYKNVITVKAKNALEHSVYENNAQTHGEMLCITKPKKQKNSNNYKNTLQIYVKCAIIDML